MTQNEIDIDTLDEIIEGVYVSASIPNLKQEWFWTDEWQAAEKAVEEDLASGNFETFDTMEDFLTDLE